MICFAKFPRQIGNPHLMQEDPSANDTLGRHADKSQRRLFFGRCEMPKFTSLAFSNNGDSMVVLLRFFWKKKGFHWKLGTFPGEIQPKKAASRRWTHWAWCWDHVDVIDFGDFTATCARDFGEDCNYWGTLHALTQRAFWKQDLHGPWHLVGNLQHQAGRFPTLRLSWSLLDTSSC